MNVNGILRLCCADLSNRQEIRTPDGRLKEFGHQSFAEECRKCGRKHYTMIAEPGRYQRIVSSGPYGTFRSIR